MIGWLRLFSRNWTRFINVWLDGLRLKNRLVNYRNVFTDFKYLRLNYGLYLFLLDNGMHWFLDLHLRVIFISVWNVHWQILKEPWLN